MQGIGATKRWRLLGFVAILAAVLSIAAIACGLSGGNGGDPTATEETTPSATDTGETPEPGVAGQLDITALEYSYENVPSSQPGGLTTITLDNIGGEEHQAQLVMLNEGVTFEQLQTALEDPTGAAALAIVTVSGGVAPLAPGTSGEVTHNLDEGSYVLLCFVPDAEGVPHFAKGMIAPFEVTAPAADQPEEPVADAEIAAADFQFTGDTTLTAGEEHIVKVTNNGPQPHEMGIVKLDEGFTADMLKALFTEAQPTAEPGTTPEDQGPPPFSAVGGLGAIMPNTSAYAVVNLEAGNYALLCFVPDPNQGSAPHAALGMVTPLTVE